MVRKGSPVRVRQRALEPALRRGFLVSGAAWVTASWARKGSRVRPADTSALNARCSALAARDDRLPLTRPGTEWVPPPWANGVLADRVDCAARAGVAERAGPRFRTTPPVGDSPPDRARSRR